MSLRVETILVLLLVVMVLICSGGRVGGQNTNFSFPGFAESNENILCSGDTVFSSENSCYEMNSAAANGKLTNGSCSRIMYTDKVQMVDRSAGAAVASFKAAFTISFQSSDPNATQCADGMAFTFAAAPSLSQEDYNRGGGGFCLLDFASTGSSDRHVFAVEFDSYQNETDPSSYRTSSHIGVDLNNKSVATADICSDGSTMSSFCPVSDAQGWPRGFCGDHGIFAAWIDYDSASKKLEVRISENIVAADDAHKPADALISVSDLELDQVLEEYMYVGFTASTGVYQETHRLHSWRFETSGMPTPAATPAPAPTPAPGPAPASSPAPSTDPPDQIVISSVSRELLVAGICAAVVACALTGISVFFFFKRQIRTASSNDPDQPTLALSDPADQVMVEMALGGGQELQTTEKSGALHVTPQSRTRQNLEPMPESGATGSVTNVNIVFNMNMICTGDQSDGEKMLEHPR